MTYDMRRLAPAVLACALAVCGCTTPDFRGTVSEAKDAVFPSLVYIRVVIKDLEGGKDEKAQVSGSGVIISSDGELITNHHVVDKATDIRCQLPDGSSYTAKVLGQDKDIDIALLKLERPDGAPPLPAAKLSGRRAEIGEVVLAMGAPWGLARSVSMGIISCNDRYLEGAGKYTLWYQTDAAISPGNSGGPLVDTDGMVIGINARGVSYGDQAFTIPSAVIIEALPRLREKGVADWSWFGLDLQPLNDFQHNISFAAEEGVIVSGTEPGSPARKAGFQPNDRIVSVDGAKVTARNWEDLPALERRLGRLPFNKPVAFGVNRDGKGLEISVAPTEKGKVEGEEKAFERWGFTAKEINRFDVPELAFFAPDGGVFISAILWDGNADNCDFRRNDIIQSIDGKPVKTVEQLSAMYDEAMKNIETKSKMTVDILRRGRKTQLVLNYLEDTEKELP